MMTEMKHVMIDLETGALTSNAAILSIGVAEFAPNPHPMYHMYRKQHWRISRWSKWNVTLDSCKKAGLTTQATTLNWWDQQDKAAQARLFTPQPTPLTFALQSLIHWLGPKCTDDTLVWANPSCFDLPILENAMAAVNLDVPWFHRHRRCGKTLLGVCSDMGLMHELGEPIKGVQHDALDDAKWQAEMVARCLEQVRGLYGIQQGTYHSTMPAEEIIPESKL